MIVTSWTIDGVAAEWATLFGIKAVTSIGPIVTRVVMRKDVGEKKVTVFEVSIGAKPVPCSRESSNHEIPMEQAAEATKEFRKELIKLWGEAQ